MEVRSPPRSPIEARLSCCRPLGCGEPLEEDEEKEEEDVDIDTAEDEGEEEEEEEEEEENEEETYLKKMIKREREWRGRRMR